MRPRLVVLLMSTALATWGLVSPAAAEVEVHDDPRGDVVRVQRGAVASADVLRLRGEHAGSSLTVAMDLVDLTDREMFIALQVRSPTGADYTVEVGRDEDGEKTLLMARSTRRGTTGVDCRGLAGRFFARQDRVVVTVPRSCLKRPRWVRFGALAAASSSGPSRIYADDARRDGGRFRDDRPVLGQRRLHHG
ncbi:hypothetical protein [Nocardioides sp. CFH 31398]|uniref:hypothetical protein n=1 Tax=Nocardioides sp. CFH 31398 TaxID=2919579 RepID=UPI001F069A8F|nr:hypothetical protein [Nocardioides sp. CFH 31398]MCH1866939.1 hypothetical protein [Nocardioides sp. CFH 31398]